MKQTESVISRYMHARGAAKGIPISGTFELTPRCNFNCKMCYVHMTKEQMQESGKRELTTEEVLGIALEAVKQGMLFLLLTGGEPFVRSDFEYIYTELKKMGLMVSLNTNASMLTEERIAFLKKNPPARVNVSLYGGSDETYEKLCGYPMYSTVTKNIRALKEAGINVRINMSVTPDNKDDIDNVFAFAREVGVPVRGTAYMFPSIRLGEHIPGQSGGRFSAEDAAKYMLKCQEQSISPERLREISESPFPEFRECQEELREGVRCRAGVSSFWLTWDGRMMPCGMMNEQGVSVLEEGFSSAWEQTKERVKEIRLPLECTGCKYRDRCNVCAASCYAETGSYEKKPEYMCKFVEELRRVTREKYYGKD